MPPAIPALRPEVGAYLDNRLVAATAQLHDLHDRLPRGAQSSSNSNGWLRLVGSASHRDSEQGFHTSDSQVPLHGGADLARFNAGQKGVLHVGVMGQYIFNWGTTASQDLPYGARQKVEGGSAGLYAAWWRNASKDIGPYVDTWALCGAMRNHVPGDGLPREGYNATNLAATNLAVSIETGYSISVWLFAGPPRARVGFYNPASP